MAEPYYNHHWRRQLVGTDWGTCPPSTSNCLIFLVTSEPHKLWHWTLCGFPTQKQDTGQIALSLFIAWFH